MRCICNFIEREEKGNKFTISWVGTKYRKAKVRDTKSYVQCFITLPLFTECQVVIRNGSREGKKKTMNTEREEK